MDDYTDESFDFLDDSASEFLDDSIVESTAVIDPDPASSNFSISGSGLTNILLIGVLVFCILIFARSRNV